LCPWLLAGHFTVLLICWRQEAGGREKSICCPYRPSLQPTSSSRFSIRQEPRKEKEPGACPQNVWLRVCKAPIASNALPQLWLTYCALDSSPCLTILCESLPLFPAQHSLSSRASSPACVSSSAQTQKTQVEQQALFSSCRAFLHPQPASQTFSRFPRTQLAPTSASHEPYNPPGGLSCCQSLL
jgi:hypothetical protein